MRPLVFRIPDKYTSDDRPLPEGFYVDGRHARFLHIRPSKDPVISIAQAIIIQALRDGCNPEWIEMIAKEFRVDLPDVVLDKIRRGTPISHSTTAMPRVTDKTIDTFLSLAQ